MTSTASIQVARAERTLRVPAAAVRFTPTEQVLAEFPAAEGAAEGEPRRGPAVWQLVDGRLTRVPVRIGVSDGTQVAITTERLVEGASIITGIARPDAPGAAAPASGSPLVPQMPRRPGNNAGGGARQGGSGS